MPVGTIEFLMHSNPARARILRVLGSGTTSEELDLSDASELARAREALSEAIREDRRAEQRGAGRQAVPGRQKVRYTAWCREKHPHGVLVGPTRLAGLAEIKRRWHAYTSNCPTALKVTRPGADGIEVTLCYTLPRFQELTGRSPR